MKAAAAAATAAENNADRKELRLRFHDCFVFEQSKKQVNQNKNHGFYSRFAGVFLCLP
jgi:TorA maturation chaperone TorD